MKRILIAAFLAPLAFVASAQAAKAQTYSPEVAALRGECAAKYSANYKKSGKDANEYHFVYSKAEYKGEQTGKALACTEDQYAAYLDNGADPSKVMSAYPTAAGRPTVKGSKK